MFRRANTLCLRLWRDESGVALAVTVVVFLTVFMMAFSVFAIGETVRQRIEIQNAADAAAYSGAVVQSDTVSRLAAVNRAMAWTYAQMGRMQMDAIVDRWLEEVVDRWYPDYARVRAVAGASSCSAGPRTGADDWYVGQGFARREHVQLNRRHWVRIDEIERERARAAAARKSWRALAPRIEEQREIVKAMNEAQEELIGSLPDRIREAVESVLRMNAADTENDLLAGGADFMFALLQAEDAFENFEVLENTAEDEEIFLNYADLPAPDVWLGRGAQEGQWYVRSAVGEGIQRGYRQRGSMLTAHWDYRGRTWVIVDKACVPMFTEQGRTEVLAEDVRDDLFYESELCRPHRLKPRFFAAGGSVVVGLARRMHNPLRFLYGAEDQAGLFRPFTLDRGDRFMWTAAAAIAAHNPHNPGPSRGEYDPTFWRPAQEHWNLKYSDWDAVLLPLHRAWAQGEARVWQGETGGRILAALRHGPWEPLHGGGGAPGAQGAPRLMNEGAELDYGAAEALILH
jgi:hypothetical protein